MSELDHSHRAQIERLLGRPLVPEELAAAGSLESLSEPVLAVARQLRAKQLALCAAYLQALAPARGVALVEFIDGLTH